MTDNGIFEPHGEIPLGAGRRYRVVSGGLDLFLAARLDSSHGRPYPLCDRLGAGDETPRLPTDDAAFIYYARALPGTRLEPLPPEEPLGEIPDWLAARRRLPSEDRQRTADFVASRARAQKGLMADAFDRFARLFKRTRVEDDVDCDDPFAAAARRTARLCGIPDFKVAPTRVSESSGGFASAAAARLNRTADANHMRIVSCSLGGAWWREDILPFLVLGREDGAVWSVRRTSGGSVVAWNGATGEEYVVDARFAATLATVGWQFVRPFPPGPVSWRSVIRCLLAGNGRCLGYVVFLAVVMSALSCVAPIFTSMVFSDVVPNSDRSLLGQIAILSVMFTALDCLLQYVHLRNIHRFRFAGCYTLQLALFDRLLRLGVNFFRDYRPAELASRLTSCVNAMKKFGASALKIVASLIMLVAPTVMLFYYSSSLAVAALLVIVVHFVVDLALYRRILRHKGEIFSRSGRLTGVVERFLRGVGKIRAAGAENSVFRIWARDFAGVQAAYLGEARWQLALDVLRSVLPISLFCATGGVVVWGYLCGVEGGSISLADFAGFTSAVTVVNGFATLILFNFDPILRGPPSFRWLKPILVAEEDPADGSSGLDAATFKGGVELDHVSFAYPGGRQILDDISLKAEPGEFIALTGESGAGKSTAFRLMLRFENPDAGAVLYDGKDIAGIDMKPLRAGFGVVMQTASTMPDTIFRNICGYGTAHTEEEVWEAARLAGCADAIREFPKQLETVLADGSVSGGQRQRFLLAQAFLRKPKIFFLDEATSALDNATQKVVVDSLAQMKATRIVIAHRLSTIRDADRIYFLHEGRIAEVGTFDELMAKNGLFARSARRQMVEEG